MARLRSPPVRRVPGRGEVAANPAFARAAPRSAALRGDDEAHRSAVNRTSSYRNSVWTKLILAGSRSRALSCWPSPPAGGVSTLPARARRISAAVSACTSRRPRILDVCRRCPRLSACESPAILAPRESRRARSSPRILATRGFSMCALVARGSGLHESPRLLAARESRGARSSPRTLATRGFSMCVLVARGSRSARIAAAPRRPRISRCAVVTADTRHPRIFDVCRRCPRLSACTSRLRILAARESRGARSSPRILATRGFSMCAGVARGSRRARVAPRPRRFERRGSWGCCGVATADARVTAVWPLRARTADPRREEWTKPRAARAGPARRARVAGHAARTRRFCARCGPHG